MSILFYQIGIDEEMLPKYTYTHTHIYIHKQDLALDKPQELI